MKCNRTEETYRLFSVLLSHSSSEGEYIQLPIGAAIVTHIDEYAGDVTLPSIPHIPNVDQS